MAVTYYNRGDLGSFYNYMISLKRRDYFENHQDAGGAGMLLEDRLAEVHAGDVERWNDWEEERKRKKKAE